FGGVAAMSARARKTEQALIGKSCSEESIADALPILEQEFTPISDVRGSAAYRQRLIVNLLRKFFDDSLSLAPGFSPATSGSVTSGAVLPASTTRKKTVETVSRVHAPLTTGL